jgi:hypothetical protein
MKLFFTPEVKRYKVRIGFPNDIDKLTKVLDWMFNTGQFLYWVMDEKQIQDGRKITKIEIVDEDKP